MTSGRITSRQGMFALLFTAAVINYLDRQSLSVAAPHIRQQFHLTGSQYSYIVVSFLLAYTLFHPIAGRLLDRLGTRTGFALAIVWWSLAGMAQSAVGGVISFCGVRFLLGMGEAAFLPASVKAVSEWCTPEQRSNGVGLTNAGLGAGAMIATPMMAWLIGHYEWRVAFLVTGATGFLWLAFWWIFPHEGAPFGRVSKVEADSSVAHGTELQRRAQKCALWLGGADADRTRRGVCARSILGDCPSESGNISDSGMGQQLVRAPRRFISIKQGRFRVRLGRGDWKFRGDDVYPDCRLGSRSLFVYAHLGIGSVDASAGGDCVIFHDSQAGRNV